MRRYKKKARSPRTPVGRRKKEDGARAFEKDLAVLFQPAPRKQQREVRKKYEILPRYCILRDEKTCRVTAKTAESGQQSGKEDEGQLSLRPTAA